MRIYLRHVKATHNCTRGARRWAERYGFDWTDFLRNGIDADAVRATDDALGLSVIAVAEADQHEAD